MNASEYQKLAMRTNDGKVTKRLEQWVDVRANGYIPDAGGILYACIGLSGEVGEFNDLIKKWVFHEKELDVEHAKKEMGDVLWYVAMMCEAFGWSMDEIMQMNVDKLKARYPEGFDVTRANNRANDDV